MLADAEKCYVDINEYGEFWCNDNTVDEQSPEN